MKQTNESTPTMPDGSVSMSGGVNACGNGAAVDQCRDPVWGDGGDSIPSVTDEQLASIWVCLHSPLTGPEFMRHARAILAVKYIDVRDKLIRHGIVGAVERAMTSQKEPIPQGVYYNPESDCFYSAADSKGQGVDFYERWRNRADEFPHSGGAGSQPYQGQASPKVATGRAIMADEPAPDHPTTEQLARMAYQLRLAPDGGAVTARLLNVLREQFLAAESVMKEAGDAMR
jgi:hypothetical protein